METPDAREKALEKIKKQALEWHEKQRQEEIAQEPELQAKHAKTEENAVSIEKEFLKELKMIIVNSNIDRKAIILGNLAVQEEYANKGKQSSKLPEIVRNLSSKNEIKSEIIKLTKRYYIAGNTLHYLWGLGE